MPAAILMLTDDGPAIRMDLSWEGEHDPESPAHQHMRLLVKRFQELCGPPIPSEEPPKSPVAQAAGIVDAAGIPIEAGA